MAKKEKASNAAGKAKKKNEEIKSLDETGQRKGGDRRIANMPIEASQERRKVK